MAKAAKTHDADFHARLVQPVVPQRRVHLYPKSMWHVRCGCYLRRCWQPPMQMQQYHFSEQCDSASSRRLTLPCLQICSSGRLTVMPAHSRGAAPARLMLSGTCSAKSASTTMLLE